MGCLSRSRIVEKRIRGCILHRYLLRARNRRSFTHIGQDQCRPNHNRERNNENGEKYSQTTRYSRICCLGNLLMLSHDSDASFLVPCRAYETQAYETKTYKPKPINQNL